MQFQILFTILLIITSLSVQAEVTLDGTLGRSGALPGPEYLIGADLGKQYEGNLFHSFRDFNLQSHETATFSGPDSVQNIISRVTGGNRSEIDGTIRSTIPNADMYFLNPYGIVFGENAKLDVQGSFHASTADYLRLGNGGRFDARNPGDSLLTVAPIKSFGFLDNSHGSIQVNGRVVLNLKSDMPRALLQVPEGKSLSLIGGDIDFSQGDVEKLLLEKINTLLLEKIDFYETPEKVQEGIQKAQRLEQQYFSQLYAPGGYINLAAIQQAGEIALTNNGIHSTAMQGGHIQFEQEAYISSTGESGGNVFIHAGQFTMDNSTIYARTLGTQDGGVVNIQANKITLDNHSKIRGGTDSLGNGTGIQLFADDDIYIGHESTLNTYAGDYSNLNQHTGNAGDIDVQAKNIEINTTNVNSGNFASKIYGDDHGFSTNTYGTGQGGDITMKAENHITMKDSNIGANILGTDQSAGNAGKFSLFADTIYLEGAFVRAKSFGSGQAGKIYVKTRQLDMTNSKTKTARTSNINNSITGSGDGNLIKIQADDILLEGGAHITSSTISNGNAGNIEIKVNNQLIIKGTTSNGLSSGIWSSSEIAENTNSLDVNAGNIYSNGNAGNIEIIAKEMKLEDGGQINTSSINKARYPSAKDGAGGTAGNITLTIGEALVVSGVNPYGENVQGFGSTIVSNTQGKSGKAGQIKIKADSVSLLEGGLIETGSNNFKPGGNIIIGANKQILISGDASRIPLLPKADSQNNYVTSPDYNTQNHDKSTSGIYAHSTSRHIDSGSSGDIDVSTPLLILSNKGQISTSSQGGGQAGKIVLDVKKLILNDHALIQSNSTLINQWPAGSIEHVINKGTIVKTDNDTYQVNLGNSFLNFMPITQVSEAEFDKLSKSEQVEGVIVGNGFIVTVESADEQSKRFVYDDFFNRNSEPWTEISKNEPVMLDKFDLIAYPAMIVSEKWKLPYGDGTRIHVKDMGNEKAADFIYMTRKINNEWWGRPVRVEYYQVTDIAKLQDLADKNDLLIGTQAYVNDLDRYLFDGKDWISLRPEVMDASKVEIQNKIYLIEQGSTYTNNQGTKSNARGGDAGQITINNADKIQLTNDSEISTSSISGGGGSVTLNVDKLVYLTNSQVSTSVQEGTGNGGDLIIARVQEGTGNGDNLIIVSVQEGTGNGGGLTIEGTGNDDNLIISDTQYVIMNNSNIIAQANEGNGGKIKIKSKQFVASTNSLVDASSKKGIDGEVNVESLDINMEDFLVVLPGDFVEASHLMTTPCHSRTAENLSSFQLRPSEGTSNAPSDLLPSGILLSKIPSIRTTSSVKHLPTATSFTNDCKREK